MLSQIKNIASNIKAQTNNFTPKVGIVLGSGLGDLVDNVEIKYSIEYKDIPSFPVSTVKGHRGRFIFGLIAGVEVVIMQGRFHFYEGYAISQVVLPIRVMKFLGIEYLFVSNAAGGVNPEFNAGDLMVITDHINLLPNPLIGQNIDELGLRFPDMNDLYTSKIRDIAKQVAKEQGQTLREGIYLGSSGPSFETGAEYRYFRTIGADAVGMSTTPEVIVAKHMGLKIFGVSLISNVAFAEEPATHEEVEREGLKAQKRLCELFTGVISKI